MGLPGVRGQLWGICLYHKGLGFFETDIGYVNIVGGWGPEAQTGNFIIHYSGGGDDRVGV